MKQLAIFLILLLNLSGVVYSKQADILYEISGESVTKEFIGYRPKTFEPLIDNLSLYLAYDDRYRPSGVTIVPVRINVFDNIPYRAYKTTVHFSDRSLEDLGVYADYMAIHLIDPKEQEYALFTIDNGKLKSAGDITKDDYYDEEGASIKSAANLCFPAGPGKSIEKPVFIIVPKPYASTVERYSIDSRVTYNAIPVDGSPFDADKFDQISPESWKNNYGTPPRIVAEVYNDTLSICWDDNNNGLIRINEVDRQFKPIRSLVIKKNYPIFGGFTRDDKGNFYLVFGKNNDDGDFKSNISIVKYDKNGMQIGNYAVPIDRKNFDVMKPVDAATSNIKFSNGMIAVHMGKTQHTNLSDGLNHQSAIFIVLNADTMKLIRERSSFNIASHSFDQRLIPYEDTFVSLDLADGYPRGINISKNNYGSRVIFTYKTRHEAELKNDSKWSNDNCTYTDLGGVQPSNTGFVVVGSSELSYENRYASRILNDPRNIFMLLVNRDFYKQPLIEIDNKPQPNIVNDRVVVSKGSDSELFHFYDYSGRLNFQKRVGVVWLTGYDDMSQENALRPKVVRIADDRYFIIWELWNYYKYRSTRYMVINESGQILVPETDIGNIRLNRADQPVFFDGKILWVTGNFKRKELNIYSIDAGQITKEIKTVFETEKNETDNKKVEKQEEKKTDTSISSDKKAVCMISTSINFQGEIIPIKSNAKKLSIKLLREKDYNVFPSKDPDDYFDEGLMIYTFDSGKIISLLTKGDSWEERTDFVYDKDGFLQSMSVGGVQKTFYYRDKNGYLLKESYLSLEDEVHYEYDERMRLKKITLPTYSSITVIEYDDKGKMIKEEQFFLSDLMFKRELNYNKAGDIDKIIVTSKDDGVMVIVYRYDSNSRVSGRVTSYSPLSGKRPTINEDIKHDEYGSIIQIGGFNLKWEY